MLALAVVFGVFGWKSKPEYTRRATLDLLKWVTFYDYGWPAAAVCQIEHDDENKKPATIENEFSTHGWQPFVVDGGALLAASIAVWVTFTRTQRNCRRWRQFSLATVLAFVALIAAACAILPLDRL